MTTPETSTHALPPEHDSPSAPSGSMADRSSPTGQLRIEPGRCIRCAAAVAIAPQLFALEARGNRVVRQPGTEHERGLARSASLVCPARAIHYDEAGDA